MVTQVQLTSPTFAGVATYPPGATFGPRHARDYEFVWIIEGSATYVCVSGKVVAPAGTILLCRPGGEDFFRWDERRRTRHAFFHFDILALPPEWPRADQWPLSCRLEDGDVLRPLFRHILRWAGSGQTWQVQTAMATLLAAFVSGEISSGEFPLVAMPETVERVLHFIHKRLEEQPSAQITLGDLAAVACVTPEHLCRLFKQATGRSPAETVRLERLDRAAVLLARSNYGVGDIAHMCGFASAFHFSRSFKSTFGCSPRELRRSILDGGTPPLPRLMPGLYTIE